MRLIDADYLENFAHEPEFGTKDMIQNWIAETDIPADAKIDYEEELEELCWKVLEGCMNVIKTEPTAYDVDKVAERLEELSENEKSRAAKYDEAGKLDMMDIHDAKAQAYRNSRRIIKSGGIK